MQNPLSPPTVAVIGASQDRSKWGNISVREHLAAGYDVYPVNPRESEVEGLRCSASVRDVPVKRLDRVTLYVPPAIGLTLLDDIAAISPREVWLNPGAGSPAIRHRAKELGLNIIEACSIVALHSES